MDESKEEIELNGEQVERPSCFNDGMVSGGQWVMSGSVP